MGDHSLRPCNISLDCLVMWTGTPFSYNCLEATASFLYYTSSLHCTVQCTLSSYFSTQTPLESSLTGQYLQWTTRRPDAKCWWCNYKTQTREHLFKNCPQWKLKPAEGSVGGGQRRNQPGQRPVQDLGAFRRREMQQGDPRLPGNNGSRTDSGPGSEATEWEKRESEEYLGQVAEEERARGEGRKIRGGGVIDYLFFLSLFRCYFICQPSKGGGDPFYITEMMKQKNKKDAIVALGLGKVSLIMMNCAANLVIQDPTLLFQTDLVPWSNWDLQSGDVRDKQ